MCAADGTGERTIADRNGWLAGVRLGVTRRITTAGPDGLPLEGWVVDPPDGALAPGGDAAGVPAVPGLARAPITPS